MVALVSFGFDLAHFSHHIGHDRTLLGLQGVPLKLVWKGLVFSLALTLLALSLKSCFFLIALCLVWGWGGPRLFAATTRSSCQRAREFMEESGVARDAKEDFLGRLKISPPRSSFPPEMDRVTWWGRFKPFEFWESPEFEAAWINPRGQIVERQSFRTGQCELAKTTLPVGKLPREKLEPGMWRVLVSCQDAVIDNHPFAVIGSGASPQDARTGENSGVMIWADELNR